jgi:hypothetical protein
MPHVCRTCFLFNGSRDRGYPFPLCLRACFGRRLLTDAEGGGLLTMPNLEQACPSSNDDCYGVKRTGVGMIGHI